MNSPKHTILCIQPTPVMASRTYYDFPTATEAVNEIIRIFERELKRLNPRLVNITYDINNIFQYIDSLSEITILINEYDNNYKLFGKEHIKSRIYNLFNRQSRN
ncbi:hypothetical protein WA158_001592 [Blastocystis sp. Blastoise]